MVNGRIPCALLPACVRVPLRFACGIRPGDEARSLHRHLADPIPDSGNGPSRERSIELGVSPRRNRPARVRKAVHVVIAAGSLRIIHLSLCDKNVIVRPELILTHCLSCVRMDEELWEQPGDQTP